MWRNCHTPELGRIQAIHAQYSKEVEKAAQDFGDHEGMKEGKILRWISNFSDENLDLAVKVLREIRYYSSHNIWSMTRNLANIVGLEFASIPWNRVIFVPIGGPYSGSATLARVLRDTRMVSKKNIKYMAELEKMSSAQLGALVFIDDFSGTGDSLKEWWVNIEPIVLPKNVPFALGLLVLNYRARAVIEDFIDRIYSIDELRETDNVFFEYSKQFSSKEKSMLLRYCESTRCSDEYVRGYGACGLLLAFKHGCPNDALPILWHESATWQPLFKRRTT